MITKILPLVWKRACEQCKRPLVPDHYTHGPLTIHIGPWWHLSGA
jgi:hypothetical protein